MVSLNPAEVERILSFQGYGNPAGVWFLGKEEGLSAMSREDQDANLIARGRFDPIMDLQVAHLTLREGGRPYDLTIRQKFTQVWVWAAKIARSLGGAADWRDTEHAKSYIRQRLGRSDGQTFITNRSPIPEKGGNDGRPWRRYFEERLQPDKLEIMLLRRTRMLKDLIDMHRPRVIICHGGPREAHRSLVLNGQTIAADQSRIETYDLADRRHVFICPFFGVGQMSNPDAEDLVRELRDRGIKL